MTRKQYFILSYNTNILIPQQYLEISHQDTPALLKQSQCCLDVPPTEALLIGAYIQNIR